MGYTPEEANEKACMPLIIAAQLKEIGKPREEGEPALPTNCIDRDCMHWVITSRAKGEGRCGFVYLKPQPPKAQLRPEESRAGWATADDMP
jgi:hypothetical protein